MTHKISPTGEGNPPGKNSDGYLSNPGNGDGHFTVKKGYRTDMTVGYGGSQSEPGNQPQENKTASLESRSNKEDSI